MVTTHEESGSFGVGHTRNVVAPDEPRRPFRAALCPLRPPTLLTIPVLRYMRTYGLIHQLLGMVSVVQREWAAKNPRRATFKAPITIEDVLNSRHDAEIPLSSSIVSMLRTGSTTRPSKKSGECPPRSSRSAGRSAADRGCVPHPGKAPRDTRRRATAA